MGYKAHPLGLLIQLNPKEARAQLVEILRANAGSTTRVAKAQGVDNATVKRWFRRLNDVGLPVAAELNRLRTSESAIVTKQREKVAAAKKAALIAEKARARVAKKSAQAPAPVPANVKRLTRAVAPAQAPELAIPARRRRAG